MSEQSPATDKNAIECLSKKCGRSRMSINSELHSGLTPDEFDAQVGNGVPANDRFAGLSPQKQALLKLRLKGLRDAGRPKSTASAVAPTIPRRAARHDAPLSFAQELLWLVDQLRPNGSAYNVPRVLELEGAVDVEALRRAIEGLIARHEVFRTRFTTIDGAPVQSVSPPPTVDLPIIDLIDLPADEKQTRAERAVYDAAVAPFDLANDLLLRATLIRLDLTKHMLVLALHHIASDGYSKGLFFKELGALYTANAEGTSAQLPDLPIQYLDYAAWQRERMQGEVLGRLLAYWKRKLDGTPAFLELPADRPRPPVQSFRGAAYRRDLPYSLLESFKTISRDEKATLFMAFLAAYKAFLHRYTGQADIVVGTPINSRDQPEVSGLIGFFINSLVLRTDVSGDPTFRELVARVRRTALEAYEHQELPFTKIVLELNPLRDLSYTPIIQTMFTVGHVNGGHVQDVVPEFPGLEVNALSFHGKTAKFDLIVSLTVAPDRFRLSCEYNVDIFDEPTIDRMLHQFETLLHGAVQNPDTQISHLPLLSEAERRQLVVEWNDTGRAVPAGATLARLFEEQVERSPHATAVIAGTNTLTYRELDARANQLARFLQGRGVGPEVPVGLCLDRSLELAVAILGTLKAGGACVPLDPAYPPERLSYIVSDASCRLLLTLDHLRETLADSGTAAVALDTEWEIIARESNVALHTRPAPEQAAYVIYTSGSTGQSKGVVLTHAGLTNHALAAIDLYGLTAADRVLQFASLSFDISLEELFPTWSAGAAVVFRPDDETLADVSFTRWIEQERITVVDLPTAYWHEWVNELALRKEPPPAPLRLVIVGGEKASGQARAAWLATGGERVRWVNTYGPTETSIIATAYEPPASQVSNEIHTDPPIGRPIANTTIYILDAHGEPLPVGVPGELYIGGAGVARGYLNRADLTASRFVTDPFSDRPDARLYRTGDRARWRADGSIEFVGRLDDQVKIRGFRVEPGEIENALERHPRIQKAVVLVSNERGDQRLIAFVTHDEAAPCPSAKELRGYLGTTLPHYMIPSAFVPIHELPLTPNGKVDRQALLKRATDAPEESEIVAPRTDVEKELAAIWCDVLGLPTVGIRDDFFELGGYSLLVLKVWNRLAKSFGAHHPLNLIFRHRTIEELASVLDPNSTSEPASPKGTQTPEPSVRTPLLLAPDLAADLAGHLDDVSVYPLDFFRDDDRHWRSLEELASGYIDEMREIQKEGPYRLGGFCWNGLIVFEMARQLMERGEEVPLVIMVEPTWIGPVKRSKVVGLPYFRRRLSHHFENLRKIRPTSWADYCRARMAGMYWRITSGYGKRISERPPTSTLAKLTPKQRACLAYKPRHYPGRLTLMQASDRVERYGEKEFGWRHVAGGGLDVHVVKGDHASLSGGPDVPNLAEAIRKAFCDSLKAELKTTTPQ